MRASVIAKFARIFMLGLITAALLACPSKKEIPKVTSPQSGAVIVNAQP